MKNPKKTKQILAISCILFLIALYLFTFVSAFFNFANWGRLFMVSLVATVAVPVLLWFVLWFYNQSVSSNKQPDTDIEDSF